VDEETLRSLLDGVRDGTLHPDDALRSLRRLPFADIGHAVVDHHRALRQGLPEAVYGRGKSREQILAVVEELLDHGTGPVVVTRCDPTVADELAVRHGGAVRAGATLVWRPRPPRPERVVLATAGSADLPVADECALTLFAHGWTAERVADVGVAGLHRLLARLDVLDGADAVVVVAGMEGALASVVGGLTPAPVVAVPTSVGYGAGLDGVTALLAMLSSCAAGVSVVGIDNGFGAACAVARLLGPAVRSDA
jgi:pyridinium-3,5-biscarboxylic acid mononucleotide synthase